MSKKNKKDKDNLYEGKYDEGEQSKRLGITIGRIGCSACGATHIGTISCNKCDICGNKLLND